MDQLISYQNNLLAQTNFKWSRYLINELKVNEQLLGIKGLRGVGKTTLLLQYLAFMYKNNKQGLYVTAEHPYFYENTLFELAETWVQNNGRLLLIDEVHKYPNWSRELKLIYDGFPNLQVIFTSSSALDLYRGEADLSRRLATQNLPGLSFREYLAFVHNIVIKPYSLSHILNKHNEISKEIVSKYKPLPLFK